MQKFILVAALAGTIGATLYAYPHTDKHVAFNLKNPAPGGEQGDAPVITGLDKLKAATIRSEPPARAPAAQVPPPSLVTSVRHEISARPATPPSTTSGSAPLLSAPKPIAAADTSKDTSMAEVSLSLLSKKAIFGP